MEEVFIQKVEELRNDNDNNTDEMMMNQQESPIEEVVSSTTNKLSANASPAGEEEGSTWNTFR